MSLSENRSFSRALRRIMREKDQLELFHLHGLYDCVPDLYTAHICLAAYFDRFREVFGEATLRSYFGHYTKMLEIERRMFKALTEDRIVAVSGKTSRELQSYYGICSKDIGILRPASRFDVGGRFRKYRKADRKEGEGEKRIGFIGSHLHTKGIVFLREVLERLSKKGFRLTCVGAGCNDAIVDFLRKNGSFKVESWGVREIPQNFYESLDCFVSCSIYESFSLSILESMSLGIPTIFGAYTGNFYDINDSGLTFGTFDDPCDIGQISFLIEKVLTDEKFRSNLVNSGRVTSSRYAWEDTARGYDLLYNTIPTH